MIRPTRIALFACFLGLAAPALAGHSELQVPPADTFLLGGEQKDAMDVSGRNVGSTDVEILARRGATDVSIATVAPGQRFAHRYAPGEIAAIRNLSAAATARLSVDFSGSPESLSMRYVLPQKY